MAGAAVRQHLSYSGGDDENDEILNHAPFCANKGKPNRKRIIEVPFGAKKTTHRSRRSSRHRNKKDNEEKDSEIVEEIAIRKANAAEIPDHVTAPSQLKWHEDKTKLQKSYYPCRICEPSEGMLIGLQPLWDPTEVALIQALEYPPSKPFSKLDRTLVERKSLLTYGEGNAWDKEIWNKYSQQRKLEARQKCAPLSKSDVRAGYLILQRILDAARERERKETGERGEGESDLDESNDSDECELDIPYAEANEGFGVLDDYSDKKKEPLRPGDVIAYTNPIFRMGDARGRRTATVLSTDPKRNPIIVIDSGDTLPNDAFVKRIKIMDQGTLVSHSGFMRPIELFRTKRRALNGDFSLRAGMVKEQRRIGEIVNRNMQQLQETLKSGGFAPIGALHKHLKPSKGQKESTQQQRSLKDQGQQSTKGKPPGYMSGSDRGSCSISPNSVVEPRATTPRQAAGAQGRSRNPIKASTKPLKSKPDSPDSSSESSFGSLLGERLQTFGKDTIVSTPTTISRSSKALFNSKRTVATVQGRNRTNSLGSAQSREGLNMDRGDVRNSLVSCVREQSLPQTKSELLRSSEEPSANSSSDEKSREAGKVNHLTVTKSDTTVCFSLSKRNGPNQSKKTGTGCIKPFQDTKMNQKPFIGNFLSPPPEVDSPPLQTSSQQNEFRLVASHDRANIHSGDWTPKPASNSIWAPNVVFSSNRRKRKRRKVYGRYASSPARLLPRNVEF